MCKRSDKKNNNRSAALCHHLLKNLKDDDTIRAMADDPLGTNMLLQGIRDGQGELSLNHGSHKLVGSKWGQLVVVPVRKVRLARHVRGLW